MSEELGMEADATSTRRRVVSSILEQGPSTARDLAERLGLTPAAIRRHLSALVEEGTLEAREQRVYGPRGRGRPSKVFVLTDAGRSEFHHSYDEIAIAAIRRLKELGGQQALHALATDFTDDIEVRFRELREQRPQESALEVLVAALEAFAPSLRPVRSGDQICQYHCPVAHVAAEFPAICEVETQLFSRLLDSHVQRLATIAHGDGVCTTHVPRPVSPTLVRRS